MGKSGKKTKSERINALRKQYDSFMEEDKKRRDRNDFILGSLEKMRMCTAVVPLHHTAKPQLMKNYCAIQEPEYLKKKNRFDKNLLISRQKPDIMLDYVKKDEQLILKEISKKYILIPKLQPSQENMVTYDCNYLASANGDGDWKNKYNILDELKKVEKGESPEFKADSIYDNFSANNDHNSYGINQENIKSSIYLSPKINAAPINESNFDDIPNEFNNKLSTESSKNLIPNAVITDEIENESLLSIPNAIPDLNIANVISTQEVVHSHSNKEGGNESKINDNKRIVDMKETIPTDSITRSEEISDNVKINTVHQNSTYEINNVEPLNCEDTSNFIALSDKDNNVKEKIGVDNINDGEYLASTNDSHNLMASDNIGNCEPLSENIEQQESEQINENTVIADNVVTSQIDEFEAEQKEMFYSEGTELNQSNIDTQEYNTQKEQYVNEQYSYYDESQQDQPYYAEIDEHEESNERYDPNYEQQYDNNYEENINVAHYDNYENQQEVTNENYVEQPGNLDYVHSENIDPIHTDNVTINQSLVNENVNYDAQQGDDKEMLQEHSGTAEQQDVYEIEQNYIQMPTEHETIQNLEKQLDGEEGYILENTIPNESTTEIESSFENSPEIQQSDITLEPK